MNLAQQFQEIFTVASLVSLLTLSALEIVLGIDNIIFVSIVAGKLPRVQQRRARTIGLLLALVMRIVLLCGIAFLAHLRAPLFYIINNSPYLVFFDPGQTVFAFTIRDLVLFAGGIFLLYKTTLEIHNKMVGGSDEVMSKAKLTVNAAIMQIVLIDILFSFDTILTAIGLVNNVPIMILAVIIGMIIMIAFSGKVSDFIHSSPGINMLALVFLIIIGMLLILQSFHQEIQKEYVYFVMGFVFVVELVNMRLKKNKSGDKEKP